MKFKTPYNYDTDVASFTSGLDCSNDDSRTQQNMADETDINKLVQVYAKTGYIPGSDLPAMNFEIDEIIDYQTAMNQIIDSQKSFMSLPSHIRDYFHNDPGHLLDFLNDSSNKDEAIRLGLVMKPVNPPAPLASPAGASSGAEPESA
ncbi:VP3 [Gokushovirus WZ-2015a]|nr:VP3 [Gokushovirus WZ-2015a]